MEEVHNITPEERFAEFQREVRKQCHALEDLDWATLKSFAERIPSPTGRIDFLDFVSQLPDGGVVDGFVRDPTLHHRNQEILLRPLGQERSRLLSEHFDLARILRKAEQIPDHLDAAVYLRKTLESYSDYHSTVRQNNYSNEQLRFRNTIEAKIALRKELYSASMLPRPGITRVGESYERVRELIQQLPDEGIARLILELIDDTLKEPGISPEKRAELRKWKEQAQAALPPASFKELAGWVERGLLSLLPKGGRQRTILIYLIGGGILLFGLYQSVERYWPKSETTPTPTPTPAASPPAPAPSPAGTPTTEGNVLTPPPSPSPQSTTAPPRPTPTKVRPPEHTNTPPTPANKPVVTKAALEEYTKERFGGVQPLHTLDCGSSSCTWLVEVKYVDTAGLNVRKGKWVVTYKKQGSLWRIVSAGPSK